MLERLICIGGSKALVMKTLDTKPSFCHLFGKSRFNTRPHVVEFTQLSSFINKQKKKQPIFFKLYLFLNLYPIEKNIRKIRVYPVSFNPESSVHQANVE